LCVVWHNKYYALTHKSLAVDVVWHMVAPVLNGFNLFCSVSWRVRFSAFPEKRTRQY
jgi:hypothetical protein